MTYPRYALAILLAASGARAHCEPLPPVRSASADTDELAVRRQMGAQVEAALASDDFAALDRMGEQLRLSRARMPNGWPKLAMYHKFLRYQLGDGLEARFGCDFRKADVLRRWREKSPRSPLPYIVEARLLYDQAWCLRGAGFSDTVADGVWPRFEKGIDAAAGILDSHRFAGKDPEYFAVRIEIQRSLANDPEQIMALVDAGTAIEPGYFPIYDSAIFSFLPQWGGSWAAIEQLARYAAKRSAATDKTSFYSRVYISLEECGCLKVEKDPDWPSMRQGLNDLYTLFPVPWNGELNRKLACRVGDLDEGKRYIRAMHPETPDERSFVALDAACQYEASHNPDR